MQTHASVSQPTHTCWVALLQVMFRQKSLFQSFLNKPSEDFPWLGFYSYYPISIVTVIFYASGKKKKSHIQEQSNPQLFFISVFCVQRAVLNSITEFLLCVISLSLANPFAAALSVFP